jgi:hypothetical protein
MDQSIEQTMSTSRKRRPLHISGHSSSCAVVGRSGCTAAVLLVLTLSASVAVAESPPEISAPLPPAPLKANYCPPLHNGRVSTPSCKGYVDCVKGVTTSGPVNCAAGTLYDEKTGICNWPSAFVCTASDSTNEEEAPVEVVEEQTKFCPTGYTGRAPTLNCGGYVDCTNGNEGLSSKCPLNSAFNSMSRMCEYGLTTCDMLVDPSSTVGSKLDELAKYCPYDYSGKAPTFECKGWVDCKAGKVVKSKNCPAGTKFDVMILACTYGEVGCEALTEDDGDKDDDEEEEVDSDRIIVVEGCQGEFTGNTPINGCKSYVYCQLGVEINKYNCAAGTLYDETSGMCTWADQVFCVTSSPSKAPTASPIQPTMTPTGSPTPLDLNGKLYYPNFPKGVCLSDGKQPATVSKAYLYSSPQGCCSKFFEHNMEKCLSGFVSEAPSSAPSSGSARVWYPDYDNNVCRRDGKAGQHEQNFFLTYENCCQFEWIDEEICLANKAQAMGQIYYPDYKTNTCRNDGMHSAYEDNFFTSYENCCSFEFIDYDICMAGEGEVMEQQSQGVGGGRSVYYPDYDKHVCRNDGKQSEFEVNVFSTFKECCEFAWIDTDRCIESGVYAEDLWYPDFDGNLCKRDGNQPAGVALSDTYTACCQKFMSSSLPQCKIKSQEWDTMRGSPTSSPTIGSGFYPDYASNACVDDGNHPKGVLLTTTYSVCCNRFMPQSKGDCKKNSEALLAYTSQPTNRPTNKPILGMSSNKCDGLRKKPCKNESDCLWDIDDGICYMPQQANDVVITPKPDTSTGYCQGLKRRPCEKESSCMWDTELKSCLTPNENSSGTGTQSTVASDAWYPDISNSRCVKNPAFQAMTDPFDSYEDCCSYPWIMYRDDCIEAAEKHDSGHVPPVATDVWYPNYFEGICLNDGKQSPAEENLYATIDKCCMNEWLDYSRCRSSVGGVAPSSGGVYYADYL